VIELHISNVDYGSGECFNHLCILWVDAPTITTLARFNYANMISGKTSIIAHLGYPTESFKSSLIYNPYFESIGVDAVVMPIGVKTEDYAQFLPLLFRLTNVCGAVVTMPHKVTTLSLVQKVSTAAKIAGACNAIRPESDGTLLGDMFDGEGFVRGMLRKGRVVSGQRALVVGSGGVGSAISASLTAAGVAAIGLYDVSNAATQALADRLRTHYPKLEIEVEVKNPNGYDIVVNATPIGMKESDPLPIDVDRISPSCYVGEVVMKEEMTPFLRAARARGCDIQMGIDMLFEQIPAYLEFFGFPTTTPDELRRVAKIVY
jgi:shikimate dehydrogenase